LQKNGVELGKGVHWQIQHKNKRSNNQKKIFLDKKEMEKIVFLLP